MKKPFLSSLFQYIVYIILYDCNQRFIPHGRGLIAHQVDHGRRDVGESERTLVLLEGVGIPGFRIVIDDAGHGIERVRGLGLPCFLVSLCPIMIIGCFE